MILDELKPARPGCCRCNPQQCADDDTGEHCQDQNCGWCLHGCPSTDETKCCQVAAQAEGP